MSLLLPVDSEGCQIPWLWLGTWSMGGESFGECDMRVSLATLELALEQGIRHFDTAGFYAHGCSEKLLAKILSDKRKQLFISTKGGLVWEGKAVHHKADEKTLRESLYASLDRFNTDYIDLYQLHWPDPDTPLEDSIAVLKSLQAEKLIRYWGVGNLNQHQIKSHIPANEHILHQVHHNPVFRSDDILAEGKKNNRCINCAVSPLEHGLLASKNINCLGNKDIRRKNPLFNSSDIQKMVCTLENHIKSTPFSQAEVIIMWIMASSLVDIVVLGCRTPKQLANTLPAEAIKQQISKQWDKLKFVSETNEMLWHFLEKIGKTKPC